MLLQTSFKIIAITTAAIVANTAAANLVVPGNVTDAFGNGNGSPDAGDAAGLLFDEARTGGSDTGSQTAFNPVRGLVGVSGTNSNWATGLPVGTAGTVTFTGLGLPLRGDTAASHIDVTIVYLGPNGSFDNSGGDDVIIGTRSDRIGLSGTAEYVWQFTEPLSFNWDGEQNNFRFELRGNDGAGTAQNLRFKSRPVNESPAGFGGIPMSVAGNFVAVPEPSGFAFFGLITLLCVLVARPNSRQRRLVPATIHASSATHGLSRRD